MGPHASTSTGRVVDMEWTRQSIKSNTVITMGGDDMLDMGIKFRYYRTKEEKNKDGRVAENEMTGSTRHEGIHMIGTAVYKRKREGMAWNERRDLDTQ